MAIWNYLPDTLDLVRISKLERILTLLASAHDQDRWVDTEELVAFLGGVDDKTIQRAIKVFRKDGAKIDERKESAKRDFIDDKSTIQYKLIKFPNCITRVSLIAVFQFMKTSIPHKSDIDMAAFVNNFEQKVNDLPEDEQRKLNNAKNRFHLLNGLAVPPRGNDSAKQEILENIIRILSEDHPKMLEIQCSRVQCLISPQYLINISNSGRYFLFGWTVSAPFDPLLFEVDSSMSLDVKDGIAYYPTDSDCDLEESCLRALTTQYPDWFPIIISVDPISPFSRIIVESLGDTFICTPVAEFPGRYAVSSHKQHDLFCDEFIEWARPFLPHVQVLDPEDMRRRIVQASQDAIRRLRNSLNQ